MAQSIKLGSDTFLDGSGLAWSAGAIQATDDLDNYNRLEKAGMWYLNGQPAHAPVGYSFMLCFAPYTSANVSVMQIVFSTNFIYVRTRYSSGTLWSNWRRYTGTEIT